MKRLTIILLCLLLAGCAKQPSVPIPSPTPDPTQSVASDTPSETAPPAQILTYTMYLPDENAEYFVTQTVRTDMIAADTVLAELKKAGVLSDDVIINSFGSEGNQLNIDFNEAFAAVVNGTGTSGERMIVGSVVNTFLSAFQAQSVFLTANGEILESGHVIYDFPIEFVE